EADRTHASKHSRGLASGNIGILPGFLCAILLFAAGLIIGLNLKLSFFLILIVYFVLSIAYSVYLKKLVLYDVFILASFYTIRVVAGGAVGNIVLSFWLIAFSIFLFLSLSFIKRYSEFILTSVNQKHSRRDYSLADITLLQIMGIGTGLLSVIVFSLYINSPEVTLLYSNPRALWVICLLLLFWISRIWLVATRGKMTVDPIVFLLKDLTSYILIILTAVTLLISI
nr:UbiA family prenyltransferase [Bacteroidota bacterium]